MLKQRIIGIVIVKNDIVVQSIRFRDFLPVGAPEIAVEYLNRWGVDEIVLLDIEATPGKSGPNLRLVDKCSRYCQVPLAYGGGIRSIEDMRALLSAGADKVILNTSAVENPGLIDAGARIFGSQCLVISIDARKTQRDAFEVLTTGLKRTRYNPVELAELVESKGAGEIFLNSIDRDGTKSGFDLELIEQVAGAVRIPVVAAGGAGNPEHIYRALQSGVSGVGVGNYFHYTEHSVIVCKSYLQQRLDTVRLDSYVTYGNQEFDRNGRISKLDDSVLEKLRFEYIPEEVI